MSSFSGLFAPAGAKQIIITTTQPWTKPADMTGVVLVECIGGGGSGSFNFYNSTISNLGGGFPGEVSRRLLKASDIPSTLTATIGAGGSPVTNPNYNQTTNGLYGGETSFGSLLKAKGGTGGPTNGGTLCMRYGIGTIQSITVASISPLSNGYSFGGEILYDARSPPPALDYDGPTAGGCIDGSNALVRSPIGSIGYGTGGAAALEANGSAGGIPGGGGGAARQTANNGYQSGAGARGEIRIWYW